MFGFSIIRTEKLRQLQQSHIRYSKYLELRRWFSGWKDLKILFDYVDKDWNLGGIGGAREDYAQARGTDQYGKPLKEES